MKQKKSMITLLIILLLSLNPTGCAFYDFGTARHL